VKHFLFPLATLCLAGGPALAADLPPTPRFTDDTERSGLDSTYEGAWQYMVGGGAAVFDCNADGYGDVFLAGGEKPASFFVNTSTRGGPLSFAKRESGLEFDAVTGAYPLDVDGDGLMDLAVLRVGENILMRGQGDCRFTRANEAWGFEGGDGWSTAFAAMWEKDQAWPTIAIGNYVDRHEELEPWGSCTPNWLHRPSAGGRGFAPPFPLTPSFCPLSMLFTDWSNSGAADLRVSNDREYYEGGQEQMWRMPPGKPPVLYTKEEGWRYLRIWGMGIAAYDLDADGFQEYFLTSMADNKLQTLADPPKDGQPPRPDYKDVAWPRGVTAHRPFMGTEMKPSTAWHTDFQDVNNDGRADLFIAKGNVSKMPDFALKDPNNLLIQNADGTFTEMAGEAGTASTRTARGGALADFNLDGLIDILVVNRGEKAEVFRNATPGAGNWLELRLSAPEPNVNAVGAFLEVRTEQGVQRREITSGGGHVSGQAGWIHFGLGNASRAEVRVRWPGEGWSQPMMLAANGFAILEKSAASPVPWQPSR
jgi:hypothetical protein